MNALVEFFRGDGSAMGRDGDANLWTPEETAVHFLRAYLASLPSAPIPMVLTCPACGGRHIDEGKFATKVHHTHACQHCGLPWRPALVATVGVQFLPGFKNAASVDTHPKDGDSTEIEAPLVSGAVPSEASADAPPPPGGLNA